MEEPSPKIPIRSEPPRPKAIDQNDVRLADLEGKLKFLKTEHERMLEGLHREIETLKERNQNLQFQLVFSGTKYESGAEEEPKNTEEISRLESNIKKLESELEEVKERNSHLENLVKELEEELKRSKALEVQETRSTDSTIIQSPLAQRSPSPESDENKENADLVDVEYEDDLSIPSPSETSTSTPTPPPEYMIKLQEAEAMIQRLQNENMTQKNEVKILHI